MYLISHGPSRLILLKAFCCQLPQTIDAANIILYLFLVDRSCHLQKCVDLVLHWLAVWGVMLHPRRAQMLAKNVGNNRASTARN